MALTPVIPPIAGVEIRDRLEALLLAGLVSAPPAAVGGTTGALIVGGFPTPGHVLAPTPNAAGRRLSEYTFAR